jgi:hypothetical protein
MTALSITTITLNIVVMLGAVLLNVVYADGCICFCYAECHYAECCYSE